MLGWRTRPSHPDRFLGEGESRLTLHCAPHAAHPLPACLTLLRPLPVLWLCRRRRRTMTTTALCG